MKHPRLFLLPLLILVSLMSCQKKETMPVKSEACLVEVNGVFVWLSLDQDPIYIDGGMEGMVLNIYDVIVYPSEARNAGVEGIAKIQYEITAQGFVENMLLLEDPGTGIGEEAMNTFEAITQGPAFSPAILDGVAVRVQKTLEIRFKLG